MVDFTKDCITLSQINVSEANYVLNQRANLTSSSHERIDLHAVHVLVEVDIDVGVGEDEAAHADVRPRTGPEGRVAGRVVPVNSFHDAGLDQLFDEPATKFRELLHVS